MIINSDIFFNIIFTEADLHCVNNQWIVLSVDELVSVYRGITHFVFSTSVCVFEILHHI